jgi:heat-inducible transcriptional repressor
MAQITTPHHSLTSRERAVLHALIRTFVASGEPVPSELVARLLKPTCSSATVRNTMVRLERLGLLEQPHTSAGRVPTDDGYRVFVDTLLGQIDILSSREAAFIDDTLQPGQGLPAEVLENASQLLSRLSHSVGFALAPETDQSRVRHVDLVRLPHPRVLAVVVYRSGFVDQRLIELDEELNQDQLQACANYINHHFCGSSLIDMRASLIEVMLREKALYDELVRRAVEVGSRLCDSALCTGRLFVDGTANILEQPEMTPADRCGALLRTIDEKGRLLRILNACLVVQGIRVVIGDETPDPDFRHASIVSTSFGHNGENSCALGVIGSKRMEYPRMIALVGRVGMRVRTVLSEMYA